LQQQRRSLSQSMTSITDAILAIPDSMFNKVA